MRKNNLIRLAVIMLPWLFYVLVSILMRLYSQSAFAHKYGDGGVISGTPCSPPCFLNIIPGKTNKNQAVKIIESQGFVQGSDYGGFVEYRPYIVLLVDSDELVNKIAFSPTTEITVKDIVDKHGEPSRVEVVYDVLSTPEHTIIQVSLYYDKIFAYISLPTQENLPTYEISPDILIGNIVYIDKNEYKRIINNDSFQEWKGFGVYQPTFR